MKVLIKDLFRPHLDAVKRKRYNRVYYGNEERAGMTRRRREDARKNKVFAAEQAFHKKNKRDYYYPKPVPDVFEELDEKWKQSEDMVEHNKKARKKQLELKIKQRKPK